MTSRPRTYVMTVITIYALRFVSLLALAKPFLSLVVWGEGTMLLFLLSAIDDWVIAVALWGMSAMLDLVLDSKEQQQTALEQQQQTNEHLAYLSKITYQSVRRQRE